MKPSLRIAGLVLLACACGEESTTNGIDLRLGAAVDTTVDRMMSGPTGRVAALGSGAVVEANDHLWWIEALGSAPRDLGAVGSLAGAVTIADRRVLATSGGFYLFQDEALVRSPLELGGHTANHLALAGPDLWVSTESALFKWRDDVLNEVRPELPTANALLAYGAPVGGKSALWAASNGYLFSVTSDGVLLHRESPGIEAIAADGEGNLWIVEGGTLVLRSPAGLWSTIPFVHGVRAIAADFGLWIVAEDGLWREELGAFHPTNTELDAEYFASTPDERLLVGGRDGLYRVRVGRDPEVIGLPQVVLRPTTIEIRIAEPDQATSVTVTLDDTPVAFDLAHPTVTVDPAALEDGAHRLKIAVTYSDGASDAVREVELATFKTRPPAWTADIAPIFEEHCSSCHAMGGVGHRLETRERWIEEIDRILAATREQRMPLPPNRPLSDAELDRIDDWRAAGFGE